MTEGPIAVVGAAGRFPAAPDLPAFWKLLRQGREAVTTLSDADYLAAGVRPDDLADPDYVRATLLTPGVDLFDADFFGMSAAEADACDPQLRMFLEAAHAAVEDAGHDITSCDSTAVFGAGRPGGYRTVHLLADAFTAAEQARQEPDLASFTSRRLGLRGPSVTVGGCSLLAVHLASQSLIAGECDFALAGGAHLELPYGHGYRWVPGGRRPPDGRTRPFDATAAGCLPGSGAGVVLLRRLNDAIADGDHIRAVILAGATGHPGEDDDGWAQPIGEAIALAGCSPRDLSYVEADGAAAGPSDAREVAAFARAFRLTGGELPAPGEVPLGSVKANIGHLATAAGVAGLLKTVLALQHAHLPAHLNVTAPHPALRLADTPFRLARQPAAWPAAAERPRRAAVHAVGPGGSNTALIIEEPLALPVPAGEAGRPRIVVWSGRQPAAADAVAARLARSFADAQEARFADLAATLRQGRTAHPVRRAAVCASAAEAAGALVSPDVIAADRPVTGPVGVVFGFGDLAPGQRVPTGLYGRQRAFTEAADLCLEAFERGGIDLYERFLAGDVAGEAAAALLFTVEYALTATWQSWGVRPAAMIGAGLGEVAAAVAAGALELEAAVELLARQRRPADAHWSTPSVPVWSATTGRPVSAPAALAGGPADPATRRDEPAATVGSPDHPAVAKAGPARALTDAPADERRVLLQVGPDDALLRMIAGERTDSGPDHPIFSTLDSVAGDAAGDEEQRLLTTLARLWVHGVPVDWSQVEPDHPLQRLPLPGYPLQRQRHWVVPDRGPAAPNRAAEPVAEPPATAIATARVEGLPAPAEPLRPLGRTEHAFWVLDQLAPGSGVSNIGIAFRTARPLRWYPLQTAVNQLLRRHPALRLRFPEVGGTPVRHLTSGEDAKISVATRTTTDERLVADLQELLHQPFDLREDFLFRAAHFTLPGGASVVCLAAHHIVIDAPSVQILVEELGQIYDGIVGSGRIPAALADEAPLLAEPEASPEAIRYWLDHLRGARPEAMVLPGSRPAPAQPTFAGHTCSWQMAEPVQQAMRRLSRDLRTTDNLVLMSAFYLTLLRHGAGPDLVIGVPVGTRRPGTEKQVGYGVSTMPLRVRVDPRAGFRELVDRVGEAFFASVEHADATVERVMTERGHGTDDWRVPLFRQMFNYRPWSDEQIRICGEVPEYLEDLFDRSRLDLQCIAVPEPDRFTLRCWHSTEVHDEAEVAAVVARMQALLAAAAAEPDRPVAELPFGSAADDAFWRQLNHTARAWPGPGTVLAQIVARAQATPSAPAVTDQERRVSYRELTAHATAVRDLVRQQGVRPGEVVALALGRSAGMAAAVLGVWAAGASYLPLDPAQPPSRLAEVVEDARARLVLTGGSPAPGLTDRTLPLPAPPAEPGGDPAGLLDDGAPTPAAAAYVIYTSGSTGKPKGVVVSHRNLHNLVCDFTDRLSTEAARAVLWSTTVTFDISALELFLPLTNGGRLVVAPDEALLKPAALRDLVAAQDVTTVQATPTAWRLLLPECTDQLAGRTLLCGGEPMPATLARELRRHGGRVFNVYGPTETTIWSTAAELTEDPPDPVPVGVPIANTQLFVTDPAGAEQPPGVPGELCIAGDGVSSGYLRRPELTAERFGEHPRYGRYYRTGDLARLRHDGVLELAGRTDRQVKLRGHRIELAEVESVLHRHPGVALAAVVLDGDPQGDGRLLAFVQPGPAGLDAAPLREALWRHARDHLPEYAVPSGITVLDRLPTTANGKVDHRALGSLPRDPDPAGHAGAAAPAGDPELTAALVELWREALRRPHLGAHDNFFLNGGHSILAARLVGRLEELTGAPAPVRAIFAHPTPAELAAHLSRQPPDGAA